MARTNKNKVDYPYNLVRDIYNTQEAPENYPDDVELAVQYVLHDLELVHQRTVDILLKYYRDKKTLGEIAAEYSLGVERIRQIIRKGIRFFKYPNRFIYIKYGLSGAMEQKMEEEYRKGYDRGYAQAQKDFLAPIKPGTGKLNLPIEDMGMTVRAYNCLKRAGINTSDEISKCGYGGLMNLRNFGRGTLHDVVKHMEYLGYDTTNLREPEAG